jgi:hypothetical protein
MGLNGSNDYSRKISSTLNQPTRGQSLAAAPENVSLTLHGKATARFAWPDLPGAREPRRKFGIKGKLQQKPEG